MFVFNWSTFPGQFSISGSCDVISAEYEYYIRQSKKNIRRNTSRLQK